jgi:RNA polymerase sigma-70 factor (ECF subfamily)
MSEQKGSNDAAPESPDPPATLEALFVECEAPLLRYARRLSGDWGTAQEIVQEAFMKLHAQFDAVRQPRPWLYRTVHNLALNQLRSRKKIVSLDFEVEGEPRTQPVSESPGPDETLARWEAIEQARLCLQAMDARGRELILMKFEQGLSYKEMSQRTGLTVSNVGYILHHALKQLGADLDNAGVSL